jgi:prepilin-type N-terminal cleavage/methylation domain-containing protein
MKNARGFTLVEILVVVVIITILATIGTLTYAGFQSQSRDQKRLANANLIADSLERYYEKNGEYPSIADVTNPDPSQVKNLLNISDTSALVMPNAPSTITNSIKSPSEELTPSIITYDASVQNTQNNAICVNSGGGCDSFTLSWKNENGEEETINSKNKDRMGVLQAPQNPIMTASISGSTVIGKVTHANTSIPVCSLGTVQYKILSGTPDFTPNWTSTSWQASDTKVITSPSPSTEYFFYAIARCSSADGGDIENSYVAKDSFFYTTATMTAKWSGTTAVGTITPGSSLPICQSGQTPKYFIQNKIDTVASEGTWQPSVETWNTADSVSIADNGTNPRKISFRGQVRCDTGTTVGTPYPQSNTDFVVSAPAKPQLTQTAAGMPSAQWTWPAISCPKTTPVTPVTYKGSFGGNYPYYPSVDNVTSPYTLTGVWNDGYTYEFGVEAVCGAPSAKVLKSPRDARSIYYNVKQDLFPGKGKFFTTDTSGNYTRGAVRIQSSSSGTYCNGQAQRWAVVKMRQNARGADGDGGTIFYNGPWASGDIRVETNRTLMAGQVGYGADGANHLDRDTLETSIWIACRNPTTGEIGAARYFDRYGILVIWGTNNSTPKPQKYRVDCTGQSLNGGGLGAEWLNCDPNGYTREGGEANAWGQF